MLKNSVAVILAGGRGTRMNSETPKVLHKISGREMILYSIDNVKAAGFEKIIILVGYKAHEIQEVVGDETDFAHQDEPLGTGDAAYCAVKDLDINLDNVLVVNGDDSAFYKPDTLKTIYEEHQNSESVVTFATTYVDNPQGIGRVLRNENGEPVGVIEQKDLNESQLGIKEINVGLYVFDTKWLKEYAPQIKKSMSGEYYIVDLIKMAVEQAKKVIAYPIDPKEWHGINTQEELLLANEKMVSFK